MEPFQIKLEPGTMGTTSQRLTSLKLPRDLKLGGKAKIVKPNLNVVRNKRNAETAPTLNSRGRNNRGRGGRGGRGGNRERDRDRGARPSNVVQSYGVFSEGVAEGMKRTTSLYSDRSRGEMTSDVSKMIDKPTFDKNKEWKVDKEEEDEILKQLLDDTFDPNEMEVQNDQTPITLPIYHARAQQKHQFKFETIVKTENDVNLIENGISERKLFETQEKLLLFKFPDTLPGLGPSKEAEVKNAPHNQTNSEANTDTNHEQSNNNKCTLYDINEGLLGKIVVYKSGKTKLVIGNTRFDVEVGPDSGFLQDVMSVPLNIEQKRGDMINLGSLQNNIIVSPEWNSLLQTE